MAGSDNGDLRTGVGAVLKHFPGHGPQYRGMDGHSFRGRYSVFPGGAFRFHLIPFQMGFDAGAAGIMPNYLIQKDMWDINPLQISSAFTYEVVTLVAKKEMGLGRSEGLVTNDTGTLSSGFGMEGLSEPERAALNIHAGSHQANEGSAIFKGALDLGLITDADVHDAAVHTLVFKFKLGSFENPYLNDTTAADAFRTVESRQLGFDAMRRSITVLRNTHHMAPTSNRYLPILGSRSYVDANADGTVTVWYDGALDGIVEGTNSDWMDDIYGKYDYTSAGSTGVLPVAAATGLADADIAVIRIASRGGSQTQPVPLSYDGEMSPEDAGFAADGTLASALASKKKVLDAFRVRDGYTTSDGTVVPAANPNLKIVLVVNVTRPPILRGFVVGLVSLDELPGVPGSYPSVSNEANIRQVGVTYPVGGGVDALLAEYGSSDRALLDVLFNQHRPETWMGQPWTSYGNGRLPMELPSTDAQVDEQYEDLPDDTWSPQYRVGTGSTMPTN